MSHLIREFVEPKFPGRENSLSPSPRGRKNDKLGSTTSRTDTKKYVRMYVCALLCLIKLRLDGSTD